MERSQRSAAHSGSGMVAIGVDVSTGRIAFGDSTGQHTAMLVATADDMPDEAMRLDDLYCRVGIVARQFVNQRPCVVFVEQPAGKVVPHNLIRAVGVVMAGIEHGLQGVFAHPVSVWPVAVTTWKKHALGYGFATKPQILRWANVRGYGGVCPKCSSDAAREKCDRECEAHDVADALGIAAAGWVLAGLEESFYPSDVA